MNTQLIICLAIFAATLVSFILNRIPLWVTAMTSLALLYLTGCLTSAEALSGFGNSNTIVLVGMLLIAAGFQRSSFVNKLCDAVIRMAGGSFTKAYAVYIILAVLLANFISSPVACYTIIVPLIGSLCDRMNVNRSKVMFPAMVVVVGCCGVLPLATAVQQAAQATGFLAAYGFDIEMSAMDYFIGMWPMLVLLPLWAIFIGPKQTPDIKMDIAAVNQNVRTSSGNQLSRFQDTAAVVIFFADLVCLIFANQLGLEVWFIAFAGGLLMILTGVLDPRTCMKNIAWDMVLLYVGSLALGTALSSTGAGEVVGNLVSRAVGGTTNNYILGAVFFIVPFIITQFMLNRAVIAVFTPICLMTCQAMGANPVGLIVLVTAGSLAAFLTPMATPAVPVAMEQGGYSLKDLFSSGWLITVLIAVVYIFSSMTVLPAF